MSSLTNNQVNARSMNGLVNIQANSGTFDEIDCNTLNVAVSATAPTPPSLSNDTNVATTAWVVNHTGGGYVDLTSTQTISGQKTFSNANTYITGNLITDSIRSSSSTTPINIGQNIQSGAINLGTTFIGPTMSIPLNWGTSSNTGQLNFLGGSFNLTSSGIYTQRCGATFGMTLGDTQSTGIMNIATRSDRQGVLNISNGANATNDIRIGTTRTGAGAISIGSTASTTQTCDMNAITTFSKIPSCAVVPTTGDHLTNKTYVDTAISSGGSSYVSLTTDQTITANQKTFTGTSLYLNDNGINANNGFISFQDSTGDGAGMYYNNDDSDGVGGLRIVSTKYGMAYSTTTGAGEHVDFLSQDINFRPTDACIFSEFAIPPPTGGQKNQIKRGAIYDVVSTTMNPTLTFTNGTQTDSGAIFTAMTINAPVKNTCNMVSVKIAFDLIAWATFGLPAGSGTIGLQFNSYTLSVLKNGGAYTPTILQHFSTATGTTQNWTKSGTQSNVQGLGAYFGTVDAVFNIDINNATADTYAIRINPTMTITNYSINFDGFKFSCRASTSGGTNGNPFFTGVRTSYTGGTLTYASSVPTFVDSSITRLANSYPIPPSNNYCFMPLNNNITPPGMIVSYVVATPPPGWLVCNGTSYPITTYPNLYAIIGNTFGGTFATGVFSLPNYSGAFLRMTGSQVVGGITYAGPAIGTAQQDSVLALSSLTNQGFWNIDAGGGGASRQVKARVRIGTDPVDSGAFGAGIDGAFPRQNTTENRPFNYSVYYIIKY